VKKKSLFSIFLIALMIGVLVFVNNAHVDTVRATDVVGIIDANTTWTQANSPYNFTGDVFVNNGVTLTIEPGVFVNMRDYDLTVNGTIHAVGTSETQIPFNGATITLTQFASNWNESTGTGCIIAHANLVPTLIIHNSPKIDNSILDSRIDTYGNGTISNCVIYDRLNIIGGEGIITNNTVTATMGMTGGGILIDASVVNATVSGNTITACQQGIIIPADEPYFHSAANSTSLIKDNLIANNTYGIKITSYSGSMFLNLIVQGNTITSNTNGIYLTSNAPATFTSMSFFDNNIYNNRNYNILSNVTCNVNATKNWWGTTDTQEINKTIYDFKNDPNWGNVSFVPFLGSLNTQAPTFVHASAGDGGFILPRGYVSVDYGGSQTFTITPEYGYHITDVLVNGTSVGAVSSYTVQNVQGATTISATFAPDPASTPTPTASPPPSSNPTASPTPTTDSTPIIPEFPLWTIPPLLITIAIALGVSNYFKKRIH
jgi:hypothetical protein